MLYIYTKVIFQFVSGWLMAAGVFLSLHVPQFSKQPNNFLNTAQCTLHMLEAVGNLWFLHIFTFLLDTNAFFPIKIGPGSPTDSVSATKRKGWGNWLNSNKAFEDDHFYRIQWRPFVCRKTNWRFANSTTYKGKKRLSVWIWNSPTVVLFCSYPAGRTLFDGR